jgi:imidazolonepropionase-like amidohydrolase
VTSVREVGGLGVYLARAIEEGTLDGPSIYGAGAILSVTGGHGDLHSLPLSWVAEFGQRDGDLRLCDGVDGCVQAVREQLRHNAKLIKVCASGGVLSELDDPIHQQFTLAELRAVVEVAAMADRVVAAHCHGKPGIMAALEAGVRTIEHGTYLDEEACAAMRETGAILVPTRTILQEMLDSTLVPPYAVRKLEVIGDRHAQALALAHQQGVTIAMGTDIALSGTELIDSWGRNGRELPLLVEAGLSPLEAIQAATFNGPLTLGRQAPRSGQLADGYDADLIVVDGDPLADITILADPAHIVGVWKAGRQVKGPPFDPAEHSQNLECSVDRASGAESCAQPVPAHQTALLDHPVHHPDDPTGSFSIRLDRRCIQPEQARSVWSRPDRRRAPGYGSGGRSASWAGWILRGRPIRLPGHGPRLVRARVVRRAFSGG